MVEIKEVNEEWMYPPDGFLEENQNDDDHIILEESISHVNKLFKFIDNKILLEDVFLLISNINEHNTW